MDFIPSEQHNFDFIPANYTHNRSRKASSVMDWLDYFTHAIRTWFSACITGKNVGFITAFPQLPIILGLLKRIFRSKRPLVAWLFNMGRVYGGVKGSIARFALSGVDIFVVHSTEEINTYSSWLRLPRERFVFVPLSIELRNATAEEDINHPFIVAMGSANRDYRLFVEAAKILDYQTIIVAGAYALEGINLPENVSVMSELPLEKCHELCQMATVNVIPVDNVTTASGQVTLLETMMYSKAVIATECVGTLDYITNGVNGILIPPKDIDAMINAIKKLWEEKALRQEIGRASRRYIEDNITFKAVSKSMSSLLDDLERNSINLLS